jgi:hypothetical protein
VVYAKALLAIGHAQDRVRAGEQLAGVCRSSGNERACLYAGHLWTRITVKLPGDVRASIEVPAALDNSSAWGPGAWHAVWHSALGPEISLTVVDAVQRGALEREFAREATDGPLKVKRIAGRPEAALRLLPLSQGRTLACVGRLFRLERHPVQDAGIQRMYRWLPAGWMERACKSVRLER